MFIPKGHQGVIPYLAVEDADAFLDFMENTFGAEVTYPEPKPDRVEGHTEVLISGSTVMFTRVSERCKPAKANLFVYVEDADETYRKALENGATSLIQPSDEHYGRSGGVLDAFGNEWWMTTIKEESLND